MSELATFVLPVGFFIAVIGAFLATNSPFVKEALEQAEWLNAHRRIVGGAMVVVGLAIMWLSIAAHG